MRTDFKSIPTMDYGRCILHLPYSHLLALLMLLSGLISNSVYGACISEVRVTLNGNGEAYLNSNMFVTSDASNYSLKVVDSPLDDKTKVDCSYRGQSVMVELTNSSTGLTCWSTLLVDDKSDYIVLTNDTLINCLVSRDSIDIDLLIDIEDNCFSFSDFVISYNDVLDSVHSSSIDTFQSFTRIWGIKDPDGNKRTVTSKVSTRRFDYNDISVPETDTVYCPENPLDVSITGVPSYYNSDLEDMCGVVQSTVLLDSVNQGCDANVKYRRLWIIMDWDRDTMVIDTQTIFRIDTIAKLLEAPNLVYTDIPDSCKFAFVVPEPNITGLGCSTVPEEYINVFINDESVAIGDSIIMDYGDFTLGYSGRDDCFNPIDLHVDTLGFEGMGLPVLSCTNIKTVAISLTDSVAQRSVRVSGLYSAINITGCIDATIVGRRIDGICGLNNSFSELVNFCIDDTMTTVSLEIAAIDSSGNMSADICTIEVNVDYKTEPVPPVTAAPDNIVANNPRASCYQLVYREELAASFVSEAQYDVDYSDILLDYNFDRVAYYLELQHPEFGSQWIWVSMKDFTNGDVTRTGFPLNFHHDTLVTDMDIVSNVSSIITGGGWNTGNLEIWNTNYSPNADGPAPAGSAGTFDFDDNFNSNAGPGYGSFQIHNYGTQQTLFAINNFRSSSFELGIGNSEGTHSDWTFANNGTEYTIKDFYVLVGNDCESSVASDCISSIDIYIDPIDTTATINPLDLFDTRGNNSYLSLTGSGSGISSTGSGFSFTAPFISFDSLGGIIGDNQFNCNGLGNYNLNLQLASVDNSELFSCDIDLWVLDSTNICSGSGSAMGSIYAWGTHSMEGVNIHTIESGTVSSSIVSSSDGTFELNDNGEGIVLDLDYNDDWYNHVTSNDLFYLEQIVTGTMSPSAMEKLSADVDGSGDVNGLDFIMLKRLLLGESPQFVYDNDPWLFYNANDICVDNSNCKSGMIGIDKEEEINIIGVKKGDIDGDVTNEMEVRNTKVLRYSLVPDRMGYADIINLTFSTETIRDANAFQLELNIPAAQNVEVLNENLISSYHEGKLKIIYTRKEGVTLSDINVEITYSSSNYSQKDFIGSSKEYDNLYFTSVGKGSLRLLREREEDSISVEGLDFSIFPNPSIGDTRLRISSNSESGEAIQVSIFDELGRLTINKVYAVRSLDHPVNIPGTLPKGVYSIMIKQGDKIATKKFIKM